MAPSDLIELTIIAFVYLWLVMLLVALVVAVGFCSWPSFRAEVLRDWNRK